MKRSSRNRKNIAQRLKGSLSLKRRKRKQKKEGWWYKVTMVSTTVSGKHGILTMVKFTNPTKALRRACSGPIFLAI